ncbi:hypothetical protein SAMN04515620_11371 [Collimonas sp. OK607]|uniref:hypothetical protein n=1 Tax=Collimonas sp. OK607 TaxID=1798194 RepID=UPI0008F0195B|nr:hypothetical protein [Collimonas sp. OK607]SFB02988.1 hypothetical protein SAMN04515620_11371 [Collimonas sp. OK607]
MVKNKAQVKNGLNDSENLTKLLGHLPPAVFCAFMEAEFTLSMPVLDVKRPKKEQLVTIEEILAGLDVAHRQQIEEVAEKIVLLSDGPGQDVIDGFSADVFDDAFGAIRNQYERAMWLYANQPELFKEALDARQADVFRQSISCYSGFIAPENLAVVTDAAARDAFHDNVAQQLGCAKDAVAIQIFKRLRPDTNTGDDVALYQISVHHNRPPEIIDCVQASELVSQEVIRALSSHITYEPANGHLEVLSKDSDGREALARIAADALLQSPISGEKIPIKQYDYQSLAAPRNFDVAGEAVSSVKVTELGYTEVDRTLLVKIWAKDHDDIYTAAKSIIGPTFEFQQHQLTYAKLTIKLKKIGKERARTISIVLRDANKCNIKTKREKDRALCDRLLAKWHLVKEIGDVLAEPVDAIAA